MGSVYFGGFINAKFEKPEGDSNCLGMDEYPFDDNRGKSNRKGAVKKEKDAFMRVKRRN